MAGQTAERVSNAVRRERTTTAILDVAERQIVQFGYSAMTMEQVAAEAAVTKGAVYFYFGSKSGLFSAVLDRVEEQLLDPALTLLTAPGKSATDRLVGYFNHIGASLEHVLHYLIPVTTSVQLASVTDTAAARVKQVNQRIQHTLELVIQEGQASGEFNLDVPAREYAALVMATMDGMLLQWHRRASELSGVDFLRAGRRSVLGGLRATPA